CRDPCPGSPAETVRPRGPPTRSTRPLPAPETRGVFRRGRYAAWPARGCRRGWSGGLGSGVALAGNIETARRSRAAWDVTPSSTLRSLLRVVRAMFTDRTGPTLGLVL